VVWSPATSLNTDSVCSPRPGAGPRTPTLS
jgi:hypothetical protein